MAKSPDYFIKLFKKTNRNTWRSGSWTDARDEFKDVFGHLGCTFTAGRSAGSYEMTPDARDLQSLLGAHCFLASMVCDGHDPNFPQDNPRDRMIACLERIKEEEEV